MSKSSHSKLHLVCLVWSVISLLALIIIFIMHWRGKLTVEFNDHNVLPSPDQTLRYGPGIVSSIL
jgi:hypothetical protein